MNVVVAISDEGDAPMEIIDKLINLADKTGIIVQFKVRGIKCRVDGTEERIRLRNAVRTAVKKNLYMLDYANEPVP
jgi:hypothetical protein